MPRRLHPYILLARFDRPIGWWLLLLPGWWIIPVATADTGRMAALMLLFLVGAVTTRAAGCVINDLWDRRLDRQVARTAGRPLAAGTVSIGAALVFLAALGLIGLAVLMWLPGAAIITGIAALPLVILYPLAKRVTWWPQAVLGLTFSWGVPLGWAAAGMQSTPALPPPALLAIYLGSVVWVFGYDTIYAVQDMVDDRTVGVKSSALGLGRHLQAGVSAAYALAIIGLGGGFWMLIGPGPWLGGLALMAIHLRWQIRRLKADDPAGALRLFQSNRDAGLILTAGMVATHLAG
ncbi:MAG: 4-hydroxybenzoate octaprenyltransferase [Pseudomonadota bacterium]|nr:4-hydroxybenzoate octaprenyltransferase [Pseudomonadota bacterium]